MSGARAVLFVLLAVNGLQAIVALAALVQGRSRHRRGEHGLARYSRQHAVLLLVTAGLLSIPVALGLGGWIGTRTAAVLAVATELVALAIGRHLSRRLHERAQRSPRAAATSAAAATATTAEGPAESGNP